MRFLLGWFGEWQDHAIWNGTNSFQGSPCLSTGAAGFSDMFTFLKLPYCLAFWACSGRFIFNQEGNPKLTNMCSGTMAPAMGPIVAGFSVPAKNWHWSMWESLWLSSPIFCLLFSLLPETSPDNILLRRAARLRKVTGDINLRSQSEITMQHMSGKEMTFNALIKPWEMNILDPAILFTTIYTAICYAIFYSFFEVCI